MPASEVLDRYIEVSCRPENPLFSTILKLLDGDNHANSAIVLKESRLVPLVEQLLSANKLVGQVEVVTPVQLRTLQTYSKMIVIGAPVWFPEHIFTAPRSAEIHILHYNWIIKKWRPTPVFPGSSSSLFTFRESYVEDGVSLVADIENEIETVDPGEVLIPFNWAEVSSSIRRAYTVHPQQEGVEARLLLVEDRSRGVFLENESKVFVIDLQGEGSSKVKKIAVTDIEPEMFVLLRTSGGGDYISTLADQRLGANATIVRERQQEWKAPLRRAVNNSGVQNMSRLLAKRGSQRSQNELNIRNWMSQETIRPRDDEDFDAILSSVGLIQRRPEFYEAASLLDSAHRSAGKDIRKLLINIVLGSDLTRLERTGRMEFELSSADGGSMTAFRVMEIAPQIFRVLPLKLTHIFGI